MSAFNGIFKQIQRRFSSPIDIGWGMSICFGCLNIDMLRTAWINCSPRPSISAEEWIDASAVSISICWGQLEWIFSSLIYISWGMIFILRLSQYRYVEDNWKDVSPQWSISFEDWIHHSFKPKTEFLGYQKGRHQLSSLIDISWRQTSYFSYPNIDMLELTGKTDLLTDRYRFKD